MDDRFLGPTRTAGTLIWTAASARRGALTSTNACRRWSTCVRNPSQASRGSDSLPAVASGVYLPAASPDSGTGSTSARRPSRPLVAMITTVAKENDHGAEDQESCCARRRHYIMRELVESCIEAGVEDRNQQHAATGAVVEPHEQGAGEE